VRLNFGLVPRTQRSASLAMRSIVQFGGALQSRGPCSSVSCGLLGPGSALRFATLVRDTRDGRAWLPALNARETASD